MNRSCRRGAFTLIEVLIVVVIMAVLAATIIPQLSSSTKDAQESTAIFNAHTMRAQIELYRSQHHGVIPALAELANKLTKATDVSGAESATNPPDRSKYPFGPYLSEIPVNPASGKNTVVAGTGAAVAAGAPNTNGWQYDQTTGGIWPAHAGWTPTTP